MISTGQDRDLSEQQLVDCVNADRGFDSSGCDGGWPHDAFNYVQQTGLASEAAYPYTARTGQCNTAAVTSSPDLARIATAPGYIQLPANSATALMKVSDALVCVAMRQRPCSVSKPLVQGKLPFKGSLNLDASTCQSIEAPTGLNLPLACRQLQFSL